MPKYRTKKEKKLYAEKYNAAQEDHYDRARALTREWIDTAKTEELRKLLSFLQCFGVGLSLTARYIRRYKKPEAMEVLHAWHAWVDKHGEWPYK